MLDIAPFPTYSDSNRPAAAAAASVMRCLAVSHPAHSVLSAAGSP